MHIWLWHDYLAAGQPEGRCNVRARCRCCGERAPLYLIHDTELISDIQRNIHIYCGSCLRSDILPTFTEGDIKYALVGGITDSTGALRQTLVAMLKQAIRTPELFT